MMKFSEAMRLGAALSPQAFYTFRDGFGQQELTLGITSEVETNTEEPVLV